MTAIHESARAVGQPYEIIVVDDASTDDTAELARKHGARLVRVTHRQIAATRNSGGRAALGDQLFFVDADTTANPQAITAALHAMAAGAVGGGAPTWVDRTETVPCYVRPLGWFAVIIPKLIGFTGGAFMFCTRTAFHTTGGFNERMFWAEEGAFALALKREGRFVVLWQRVITSGRRFRKISGLQLLAGGGRMLCAPFKAFTHRAAVQGVWYDSDRSDDDRMPDSWGIKTSNAVALVILLVIITEPIWTFTPWSWTPLESWLGKTRFVVGMGLCHAGLLLWPVGLLLLVNLLRQKRATAWWQSVALIVFLWWQAWSATIGIIRIWRTIYHWLMST